jgi:hypothetical protein
MIIRNNYRTTPFKHMVKLLGVSFLIFLSIVHNCFSQTKNVKSETGYQEELTVLTDRDIYIAGEKIYLKIFKLNRSNHIPDNVSKIVYTQLIDSYSNAAAQVKIKISGNSGAGEIVIPDTIPTGNYLICSCTSWMQNFSCELYSYKRISIINPFRNLPGKNIVPSNQQPDSIAFYPECGHIISGLNNFIGCRGFNRKGYPVSFYGSIVGDSGTKSEIKTATDGICFFAIKPKPGEKFSLVTENRSSKTKLFHIPPFDEYGTILSIKTDNNNFIVRIQRRVNTNNCGDKFSLQCSAISGEIIKREILSSDTLIVINKGALPAGFAEMSVSDNKSEILAKRWVYNDRNSGLAYNISFQNPVYYTRDMVKITVEVDDLKGAPRPNDLLVSVVKSFSLDNTNTGNCPEYSQLPFLTSVSTDLGSASINDYLVLYPALNDLFAEKGSNDKQIDEANERYEDQKQLLNNEELQEDTLDRKLPRMKERDKEDKKSRDAYAHLPELEGLIVSGKISNIETDEPLKNKNVILSFVGNTANCSFAKTNENGIFYFNTKACGLTELVIQPIPPCNEGYYVEMDNPFPETISKQRVPYFFPDTNMLPLLNKAIISMQVQGIYSPYNVANKATAGDALVPDFFGEPLEEVYIKNYIELSSLKEIIKEIVPALWIGEKDKKSYFKLASESDSPPFENAPLVLVDGVPVNDIDKILAINPRELEKIEVLRKRYYVADIIFDGIIQFITKKANLSAIEFDKSLFREEFRSVQNISCFYSPDYSTDSLRNSRIPDFRNTLYWNPCLMTDKNGKATAEFFTSDEPGEYTVVVEGMSPDGTITRTEKKFFVAERK